MVNKPGEAILQTAYVNAETVPVTNVGSVRLYAYAGWADDQNGGVDTESMSGTCMMKLSDGRLFEDRTPERAEFSMISDDFARLVFQGKLGAENAILEAKINDVNDTVELELKDFNGMTIFRTEAPVAVNASRIFVTQKFRDGAAPVNTHPITKETGKIKSA